MKTILYLFCFLSMLSCSNEKELQLAEISNSQISKITDVSPAYLFFNPSKSDSLELNRKNLISTTNWLINIDKRLTLKQVIPSLMQLQAKKKDATHKNQTSRNYFTGFNPELKTLRFIDFTSVIFHVSDSVNDYKPAATPKVSLVRISSNEVTFQNKKYQTDQFIQDLNNQTSKEQYYVLCFDKALTFQDYLSFKDALLALTKTSVFIDDNEFIY